MCYLTGTISINGLYKHILQTNAEQKMNKNIRFGDNNPKLSLKETPPK